jgi:hypothetical protein
MDNKNKIILIFSTLLFVGGLTYYIVDKQKVGKAEKK